MGTKIGELLVSQGRVSQEILSRALELQSFNEKGLRLGGILLKWGLLSEEEVLEALGRIHRCPFVSWSTLKSAQPEAVQLLSPAQASRLQALPYCLDDRVLRVAFVNPSDLSATDEVAAITGKRVQPAVTMEVRLLQALQQFYGLGVGSGVWAVLQRVERRSKQRQSAAVKIATEIELSDTVPVASAVPGRGTSEASPIEDAEAIPAAGAPIPAEPVGIEEPEPLTGPLETEEECGDPFSDRISLERFIEDAIGFFDGLPNLKCDIVDEAVEDLDPSTCEAADPRFPARDPNATTPSHLHRPAARANQSL